MHEQREKLEQLSTIHREYKPKDASEILASELGKSSRANHKDAGNNMDDMFSGFSISAPPTAKSQQQQSATGFSQHHKPKEQLKVANDVLKISHNTAPKPDILSCLMNSNLSGLGASTNAILPKPPSNTSVNNMSANANASASSDAWTSNWQSANPLVMNNQLALPPPSSNNNFSSLNDLDGNKANSANSYGVQKPAVNYIYPAGYNAVSTTSPLMGGNQLSGMGHNSKMTPLLPQQTTQQSQDSKNLNTLSQQEILNFLN